MEEAERLVVISGPSGVGKSTIVREVLRRSGALFSVSVTTRAPRPGEAEGKDYRFVDRESFQRMISRGELLEWAEVFGELYGTPLGPVREAIESGRTMLLDIDVQGAMQVHGRIPQATFVLVLPPGDEELARRLAGRCSENNRQLARRLSAARHEVEAATSSGIYKYRVVNDDLEQAVGEVLKIVKQERSRR